MSLCSKEHLVLLLLCAPTHGQLHAASHDRAERGSSAGSTELCSPPQPLGKVEGSDPTPCRAACRRAKRAQKNPTGGGQPQGSAPRGPTAAPHPGEGVREPHRSCALSPRVSGTRQGTELRAHPQWIPPLNPSPSAQQSGSANQPPDPT